MFVVAKGHYANIGVAVGTGLQVKPSALRKTICCVLTSSVELLASPCQGLGVDCVAAACGI